MNTVIPFHIAVLGATSAVAKAVCRFYVQRQPCVFMLVGRDPEALALLQADLLTRGALSVQTLNADLADCTLSAQVAKTVIADMKKIDLLLVAYGVLGVHHQALHDSHLTEALIRTNFTSVACLLAEFTGGFEKQGYGHIAVLGSVAGDRGRQSNFIYGSAKGAMAMYLQGLRHHFFNTNIKVVCIKMGFVDTPMTASFQKGPLWTTPEALAPRIVHAIDAGKGEVYLPWFWTWIMTLIRLLPDMIFLRTKL